MSRPTCLSYEEILAHPDALERLEGKSVRIDSPGENETVSKGLIALGGGPTEVAMEFGEVAYLGEYHRGFCVVMRQLESRRLSCLNSPNEIMAMFDKWESHTIFAQHGVSRPPSFLAPKSFEELRERCISGAGGLFLKPLHGSSASGVCALRWSGEKMVLQSPVAKVGEMLFNNLQVRRYENLGEISFILERLLSQGMIAERWIPKISLPGGVVDLRVLVIGGQARHRVVRQSRHPMTNLHLGNRRCPEELLMERLGEERWQAALKLAEQAAACFPKSYSAGVDILLDSSGRAWVGEINAFGDLLPHLTHRGQTAYQAIAEGLCASAC